MKQEHENQEHSDQRLAHIQIAQTMLNIEQALQQKQYWQATTLADTLKNRIKQLEEAETE